MTAQSELGPVLPSRFAVFSQARELRQLADTACELTYAGPRCDVARALAKLDQARALLGVESFSDPAKEPDRASATNVRPDLPCPGGAASMPPAGVGPDGASLDPAKPGGMAAQEIDPFVATLAWPVDLMKAKPEPAPPGGMEPPRVAAANIGPVGGDSAAGGRQ